MRKITLDGNKTNHTLLEKKTPESEGEAVQNETYGKKIEKKMKRASLSCGTIWSNLIYSEYEFSNKGGGQKNIWRNDGPQISKSDENYKSTDPESAIKPNPENMNRTTPKHLIVKSLKTSKVEKILKSSHRRCEAGRI